MQQTRYSRCIYVKSNTEIQSTQIRSQSHGRATDFSGALVHTRPSRSSRPHQAHHPAAPTTPAMITLTPTFHIDAPPIIRPGAAFAPGSPAACQSLHAAYISRTNAWPSGLMLPCAPTLYGFTTGVSHMLESKCARADELEEEESAVRAFSARGRCVCVPVRSARR